MTLSMRSVAVASAGTTRTGRAPLVGGDLLVEVVDDPVEALRQAGEPAAVAAAQGDQLPSHRIGVLRHLGRQVDHLPLQQEAEAGHGAERHEDDRDDREDTAQGPFEPLDRGAERERHDDRQRERDEDRLGAAQDRDQQREGGQPEEGVPLGAGGRARRGRRRRRVLAHVSLVT